MSRPVKSLSSKRPNSFEKRVKGSIDRLEISEKRAQKARRRIQNVHYIELISLQEDLNRLFMMAMRNLTSIEVPMFGSENDRVLLGSTSDVLNKGRNADIVLERIEESSVPTGQSEMGLPFNNVKNMLDGIKDEEIYSQDIEASFRLDIPNQCVLKTLMLLKDSVEILEKGLLDPESKDFKEMNLKSVLRKTTSAVKTILESSILNK